MEANGSYKPNEEFISAIRGLRFTMRFLGIWQQPNMRGWYNLVWYVQSVGLSFHVFGPTAGLIVNRHDASKTIGNLGLLIPTISIYCNWIAFSVHSKTVGKLLHFIEEDWFDLEKDTLIGQSVPGSKQLMKKHYQSAKTFFLTFVSMMMLGVITYLRDSLSSRSLHANGTDYDRANLFLLPYSWFPLDYNRGYTVQLKGVMLQLPADFWIMLHQLGNSLTHAFAIYYKQTYQGWQIISLTVVNLVFFHNIAMLWAGGRSLCRSLFLALSVSVSLFFCLSLYLSQTSLASASVDNFFITVILHLCAQFKILGYFIESITHDSSQPECSKIKVRRLMRRHQELLRAAENMQKLYNFIIVVQCAAVTLTLCLLGYAIIVEMEKIDSSTTVVIKNTFFCGAFLLLIFSYCFVGNRLTNQSSPDEILTLQSNTIATAVYNSDWYNCPRSICLSFLIVMARANRPVEITGAKLMTMSLESFKNLIKASASYLSVLRAMGLSDE